MPSKRTAHQRGYVNVNVTADARETLRSTLPTGWTWDDYLLALQRFAITAATERGTTIEELLRSARH